MSERFARELRDDAATLRQMANDLDVRAAALEAAAVPSGVPERYKHDLSIEDWERFLVARGDADRVDVDAIAREAAKLEIIRAAVAA